jgi:Type II/IV secretion system protein/N-terminal domain of anti-restriction factor ArdC
MKLEQVKQLANKAIEQLSQALEKGQSETLRNYLAAIGRFHRYSLRNVMLIASQKPTATHVAGFHAWRTLGRFVKKGERGILILAPIVRAKTSSTVQTETDESSTPVGFRAAYVFDISQTDGQELPELGSVNGDPSEFRERLGKLITEQGIVLEYSQDIAPARGTSAGGKITLLPGQSPAEEFATLAHELAHEMLHRDQRRAQTTKRVRETEAEAVSFVVCSGIGLETGSAAQETTLLNILGKFIGDDERILLIEDTAEIQLGQPNTVRFEARQAQNALPAVTIRDLLKASLRHRPDRIILGEIRGGEAFDLLQLLNTGHSGTLSTIHANSAKQGLSRFTSCVLQSGIELPYRAIKTNIGDSLNIVIQIERRPGRRFISEVLEIRRCDPDADDYEFNTIFQMSEDR